MKKRKQVRTLTFIGRDGDTLKVRIELTSSTMLEDELEGAMTGAVRLAAQYVAPNIRYTDFGIESLKVLGGACPDDLPA